MELFESSPFLLPLALGICVAGLIVLGIAFWRLSRRQRHLDELWRSLSDGVTAVNLEQALQKQLRQSVELQQDISALSERLTVAESKLTTSKRYVGLIRYDAFEDVGGGQSFSLAVFDEQGDGAVVTSQVGRMDCRVFGKLLRGGKSDANLTHEEEQAIEEAVAGRKRPKIGL